TYKALDKESHQEVALKVVHGEFLPDEEARQHFQEKMWQVRELDHPNALRCFHAGKDGDRCYFVTELLEGLSLQKIIDLRREKGQRFSVQEVELICGQLCAALGMDGEQIVHGGLKPTNIIILPDVLKVTDFGVIKAVPGDAFLAAQRNSGESFEYLAPEVRNQRPFDAPADVYSIGAILVELISGEPYRGGKISLREIDKEVLAEVDEVVAKALEFDPDKRYPNTSALGQALTLAFAGLPPHPTNDDGAELTLRFGQEDSENTVPVSLSSSTFSGKTGKKADSQVTHRLSIEDIEIESDHETRDSVEVFDHTASAPKARSSEDSEVTGRFGSSFEESENTQKVAPNMIVAQEEQDPGQDLLVSRETWEAMATSGETEDDLPLGLESKEKPRANITTEPAVEEEKEARARDVLQAFSPDPAIQVSVSRISDKEGPFTRIVSSATALALETQSEAKQEHGVYVAPEVLFEDAVPKPMGMAHMVTRVPESQRRNGGFFLFTVFMLLVGAGIGGAVLYVRGAGKDTSSPIETKPNLVAVHKAVPQVGPVVPQASPMVETSGDTETIKKFPRKEESPRTLDSSEKVFTTSVGHPIVVPRDEPTAMPSHAEGESVGSSRRTKAPSYVREMTKSSFEATAREKGTQRGTVGEKPRTEKYTSQKTHPEKNISEKKPVYQPSSTTKESDKAVQKDVAASSAAESKKKCYPKMTFIPDRKGGEGYCVDRYEAPGARRQPFQGVSFAAAKEGCRARGLRLCTAKEWIGACGRRFPYGQSYDGTRCNTGGASAVLSGSKRGCRSSWGIYDMSGNVSEWVDGGIAVGGDARASFGKASCTARSGGGALTGYRCCSDPRWDW
ncbi:MAG: bifunctional serine/threonine-protein kinase/formylglycine-generating enzyme family protein, partial [Pseudomonadota bacterium]